MLNKCFCQENNFNLLANCQFCVFLERLIKEALFLGGLQLFSIMCMNSFIDLQSCCFLDITQIQLEQNGDGKWTNLTTL